MDRPCIVLGGGGHSRVLIDTLKLQSVPILGIVDPAYSNGQEILGIPVLGKDELVFSYAAEKICLINGLGMVSKSLQRHRIFDQFKAHGYMFASVIHPSAIIGSEVSLGEGVQIMAGAVIQVGSTIGDNAIINTRVSVDHEVMVRSHAHLAPGVTLSGGVKIGIGVLVGAGATIIHNVVIGAYSVVAAGAVVVNDVPEQATVMGVPAREVTKWKTGKK